MWQLCMDEIGWNRFIRSKQGDFHVWWKTDGKKNCQKNLEPKVFLALCKKAFIEAALASRQSKTTFLLLCWRVSCRLFFFIFFFFFSFYIWPRDLLQPGWSASSLLKNNFFLIHTYPLFFFFLFLRRPVCKTFFFSFLNLDLCLVKELSITWIFLYFRAKLAFHSARPWRAHMAPDTKTCLHPCLWNKTFTALC